MLSVRQNHEFLKSSLPQIIDLSGYSMNYLAKELYMPENIFHTKKNQNAFSRQEFETLITLIWSDEFQDILDEDLFAQKMQEGKNLTAVEFKQKMGWL